MNYQFAFNILCVTKLVASSSVHEPQRRNKCKIKQMTSALPLATINFSKL